MALTFNPLQGQTVADIRNHYFLDLLLGIYHMYMLTLLTGIPRQFQGNP